MHNLDDLSTYMADKGVVITDPIVSDGQLHRFSPDGKKNSNKCGWYIVHDNSDFMVACFGDWSVSDECYKWCSVSQEKMTKEQRITFKAKVNEAREQVIDKRNKTQAQARIEAARIWNEASNVVTHAYLDKKHIDTPIGIKQCKHPVYGDSLVIPLYDQSGLSSLQFIFLDKENITQKRYLPDGAIKSCYMTIGTLECILLAEGYATAWSLHKATGDMCVVSFSCHNMVNIASILSDKYDRPVVICADNDSTKEANAGIDAAIKASSITAYPYTYPIITNGSDFNDVHAHHGLDEIKRQIQTNMVMPKSKPVAEYLATFNSAEFVDCKKRYAKRLGINQTDLVKLVKVAQKDDKAASNTERHAVSVIPYSHPVEGHIVAFEVKRALNKHLFLPDWCDVTVTLWIIASYLYDSFRIFPRLLISSPEKGCGKTTLLDLIEAMANKPLSASK